MHKTVKILLVVISLTIAFASCGRYENGPAFSVRSAKARIVGEWALSDLLVNDTHEQTLYDKEASFSYMFSEDGTYSYNMPMVRASSVRIGLWSFGEDKTELVLTQIDTVNGNIERSYRITRLTNTEMWVLDGNGEYSGIDGLIERRFEKIEK